MSYKYSSEIVILNKLSKSNDDAKAELYETYDQLRDLTVSGPSIGGAGLGPVGGFLFKLAQMISGSSFLPTLGTQAINIPGTSYFSPISGGTGANAGAQSSFGLGPMAQFSGFPSAGSAAGFDAASILSSAGFGGGQYTGLGDPGFPNEAFPTGSYTVAGGAASMGSGAANLAGVGSGLAASAGFGRNFVMPAAGIVSGIGGLLTTLSPLFGGGAALAGLATGSILSGFSGSVLAAYQHVSNRILVNADTILTTKVKNIETVVRQLDAQEDIIKKLLKESVEGDKKALQDL